MDRWIQRDDGWWLDTYTGLEWIRIAGRHDIHAVRATADTYNVRTPTVAEVLTFMDYDSGPVATLPIEKPERTFAAKGDVAVVVDLGGGFIFSAVGNDMCSSQLLVRGTRKDTRMGGKLDKLDHIAALCGVSRSEMLATLLRYGGENHE